MRHRPSMKTKSFPLAAALLAVVVMAGTRLTLISSASAHSWYPKDCCSDRDCMPADAIGTDQRGDRFVMVCHLRIWAPQGFAVRPSQDGRIHICFHVDDHKFLMPLCLFLPAQSY